MQAFEILNAMGAMWVALWGAGACRWPPLLLLPLLAGVTATKCVTGLVTCHLPALFCSLFAFSFSMIVSRFAV